MTMYGYHILALWAAIYCFTPQITGNNQNKRICGNPLLARFRGIVCLYDFADGGGHYVAWAADSWKKTFKSPSVILNAALYWVWRSIGGTLMFISHLIAHIISTKMVRERERCCQAGSSSHWKSTLLTYNTCLIFIKNLNSLLHPFLVFLGWR